MEQKLYDMINSNNINCTTINNLLDQFIVDNGIIVEDGDEIGIESNDYIALRLSNRLMEAVIEEYIGEYTELSLDAVEGIKTVIRMHECLEAYYILTNQVEMFGSHANKRVIEFEKLIAVKLNVYNYMKILRYSTEINEKANYEAIYDLTGNSDAKYWLEYINEMETIYN